MDEAGAGVLDQLTLETGPGLGGGIAPVQMAQTAILGSTTPADYRATPGSMCRHGSWLEAATRNVDIIELALGIDREGRTATPYEQQQLGKYVGFGAAAIRNNLFPVPPAATKAADPDRQIWPDLVRQPAWRALAERLERLPGQWQRSILQSTQYAHFTAEETVRMIWRALQHLGFAGGKLFEPGMGIGHFPILMPEGLKTASSYTGVEFDGPTASIARLLLPLQNVLHDDFTKLKCRFPNEFFDAALGNVPFAQTKVYADPAYEKLGFVLHDFFLAKSVDLVRPGGLLAFITSRGTMDKPSDKARAYLAARADLLGAIRLPSTAFEDNAGTSVVADILFLRKRDPGKAENGAPWRHVVTIETADGPVVVNEYFRDQPAMVLGQHRISGNRDDEGRAISANGQGPQYTVISYDKTRDALDAKIATAIDCLPQSVYTPAAKADTGHAVHVATAFDPRIRREGVLYLADDGTVKRVERGFGKALHESVTLSAADRSWFTAYVGLRDLVQEARHQQASDGPWEPALAKLNEAYDDFRRCHGPLNAFRVQMRKTTDEEGNTFEAPVRIFVNRRRFREDFDSPIVTQLEVINEEGKIVKAPFLLGRTVGMPAQRDVRTIADALAVSLDALGRLDLDDVGRRIGMSRQEAVDALGNQVYKTPAGEWQLADQYLSGDVVGKLEEAEQAVRLDPALARNVEALKMVQPEKLGPSQISAKLGASWIPAAHVAAFAAEIEAGDVTFDAATESWQVEGGNCRSGRSAGHLYGTDARSPSELLEAALNSRVIKVIGKNFEGKPVTDASATTAANEVIKKIKDKFKSWIWTDAERVAVLVDIYNRRFNNIAPRQFDGSHLTLPGVSLKYRPYPHQKRGIWRIVASGNTYLAHAVGAGKTMEMVAAGMEQRRLGLIKKPMYVVPNNMLQQFALEFLVLYPLASILVADEENFSVERRAAFVANATLNNPDAIVITHDAFQRLGMREESIAPIRDEILTDLEIELSETEDGFATRVRRRQLQQQIEAVSQRFDRIAATGRAEAGLTFEDIDADFLFVDESHLFRKLDFYTTQQIKGIDPHGSKRALDMYVKTRWLDRQRPGRAFAFASGTPVTNTMGELFSVMRFFAPDELKKSGIATFDAWSRQFGEVAASLEPNAAGKYELVTRFSRFDNVPELMSRIRNFMDVLTSDYLGALVKRPTLKGGRPNLNIVEPGAALQQYMRTELAPRIEASRNWRPTREQPSNPDPVVSIITDGRFAAIDPRFFGGELGPEGSIITVMAAKVAAAYHAGTDRVYLDDEGRPEPLKGSAQLVFYNLGFGKQAMKNRGFNARAAFTACLVKHGIPREQIGWFEDASTYLRKEAMRADIRSGKLRVLIGSAKQMGTAMNGQDRLAVLHYQDPPWFPADVEQPHGRILRQGNQNAEVQIEWYTTKQTYQSSMWMMVARKARFIEQAFAGDKSLRSMDDLGEASLFEQAAAVASGDPRAILLAGLRQEVERFERLQVAHASEQIKIRSALRHAEWSLENADAQIAVLAPSFGLLGEKHFAFTGGTVGATLYDQHGKFGAALKDAFNVIARTRQPISSHILARLGDQINVTISGSSKNSVAPPDYYHLEVSIGRVRSSVLAERELAPDLSPVGLAQRIVNLVNGIGSDLERARSARTAAGTDIARLRRKVGAPFEYAQEMAEKYAELRLLEESLQLESRTPAPCVDLPQVGIEPVPEVSPAPVPPACAPADVRSVPIAPSELLLEPPVAVAASGVVCAGLFGKPAAMQVQLPLAGLFDDETNCPADRKPKRSVSRKGKGTLNGAPRRGDCAIVEVDLFGILNEQHANVLGRAHVDGTEQTQLAKIAVDEVERHPDRQLHAGGREEERAGEQAGRERQLADQVGRQHRVHVAHQRRQVVSQRERQEHAEKNRYA